MKRHVACFVEKAGFEPRTLGTEAERQDHCATHPVMRLDTTRHKTTRGGRTCCVLPTWPCALQQRVCTSLGRFSRDRDFNCRRDRYIREVKPQDAWSINFFQDLQIPCHKRVGATAVAHLRSESIATIFLAAHLTRTSPEWTYGQLLQLPLQGLPRTRDARVGTGGGLADPARTSTEGAAPITPSGGVIEPLATMEHSGVSRAAPRAEPATVARKHRPARPSRALGPAWADESSWAVPLEDDLENEPDVLCCVSNGQGDSYPAEESMRTFCAKLTSGFNGL
jgi:hypothetical protein